MSGMDYDRRSAVSSFYGGRRSSFDALNSDFPSTSHGQPERARVDSASSFFQPDGTRGDGVDGNPSAGYNRMSYFDAGRVEPVKGGHDEESQAGDGGWDVFADFNNTGPRYSTAFGRGDAGYRHVPSPTQHWRNDTGYRSSKFVPEDEVDEGGPVEMVTVPALGPEWKASELHDMTKKAKREEQLESTAQKWKEWRRGERGLCGRYFTRKFTAWFVFILCAIAGILLAFLIPRVPGFSFNSSSPLVNAGAPLNTTMPTEFSRAPANFSFPAAIDLQTLPARAFPAIQLPLNFTYVAANDSDQTWVNWYNGCKNKATYADGQRPAVQFRIVLGMHIAGLIGTKSTSTEITDAACPIELPQDSENIRPRFCRVSVIYLTAHIAFTILFSAADSTLLSTATMDRRYPSASSALSNRSSIRHRSGAFSPKARHAPLHEHARPDSSLSKHSEHSERSDHTLTVQVEDVDAADSGPTVLLVRRSRASSLTPRLPTFSRNVLAGSGLVQDDRRARALEQQDGDLAMPFSPVPLTPRPPQSERGPSACSAQTLRTSVSQTSRLPTPDFTTRIRGGISSYLPRLFSVRRPATARPPPVRNESVYSTDSADSTAVSVYSVCESTAEATATKQRPPLLPSFSTNDKFTRKFPRPRAVRNSTFVDGRGGQGPAFAANILEEEGEGLGIEQAGRWTIHKWCLILSVCTIFVYGIAGLVCAILTWFRAWPHADVMYVADNDILTLITLASAILLLTFLVGISGALLNSRPILAVYAVLLWPALIAILAIGYTAYKRYAFALDRKLNLAWSQWYTPLGRLIVQDSLRCCGFYSALHEATASTQCYPRTPLPGCKGKLFRFERQNLATVWAAAFALVPVHIANIIVSLLCANHVTRIFGKGITPKQYRLSEKDVHADAQMIMNTLRAVRPVLRPELTRAPLSGVFREDKESGFVLHEYDGHELVQEEWECLAKLHR
ncbi:hypothetical protein A0H81_08479 [Grifola frondosa]|uniref:Tetraspanin Tsp2 n=1 Tax=Grifola frondosa TaxID=5627 RepID=A0A1C7M2Y9_GRIFR|nr:hypothetical protein A0H81_08479 [Grifola frondosa]